TYRLTKILKNESLAGFSVEEISELISQRTQLKKRFANNVILRQFGRANGFEQARLIKNTKTNKIHMKIIRSLEQACEPHLKTFKNMSIRPNSCSLKPWQLMPAS